MMRLSRFMPIAWVVISLFLINGTVFAQGKSIQAKARHFGIGQPKNVQDLPHGKLRKDLLGLPRKAQGKALGWLQRFEFPVEDIASLRVNANGDISYADVGLPEETETVQSIDNGFESANIGAEDAFLLHSRPGASNVLFLDFDGHVLEGTAWSAQVLEALPFDPAQNDSPVTVANFTQDELNRIHEIWHRISEDYAAFNIDVTTEEPAVFTARTGRILFTHDSDVNGSSMPSQGAGGVAFVNVFGRSDFVTRYSPALVYYTNLSSMAYGVPAHNAEAASHEFGHNLGLGHDGASGTSYYEGHGTGLVTWAPIMGRPYYKNVTQWSKGEYPGANNTQDDIAILASQLGYVADDHSNFEDQASPIVIESNGDILVSSPQIDPHNDLPQNKGIIDSRTDVDLFYVDLSETGSISINATPAWHSFTLDDGRGSNLDIELTVYDSNLSKVEFSEPDDNTNAIVTAPLQSGRYYIEVNGTNNVTQSLYSDYGSLGMYFLEGHISSEFMEPDTDTTPPSPSLMSWQSPPSANGETNISMTAIAASDESGVVEYFFTCVAGGIGCVDSGWQASRTYELQDLEPGIYYAFKVVARDAYGNPNTPSSVMGVTTDTPPVVKENELPVAVVSYSPEQLLIEKGKSTKVTLDGSGSYDPDGSLISWSWSSQNGEVIGSEPSVTLTLKEGTYSYSLQVTDDNGAVSSTDVTFLVSKPGAKKIPPGKKK